MVSIHTPTQGVTMQRNWSFYLQLGFNPHTHAGCDTPGVINQYVPGVSIHTPTQGVTLSPIIAFFDI